MARRQNDASSIQLSGNVLPNIAAVEIRCYQFVIPGLPARRKRRACNAFFCKGKIVGLSHNVMRTRSWNTAPYNPPEVKQHQYCANQSGVYSVGSMHARPHGYFFPALRFAFAFSRSMAFSSARSTSIELLTFAMRFL